jgi:hypothetical protein
MTDESKNLPVLDGFDEIENEGVEGEDEGQQGGRIIQGTRLLFTNDFVWMTSDDEEFSRGRELAVVDTTRVVQKWVDQKVEDTILVPPSQKWPDVDKLNEACPKSEWQEGPDSRMRGPWQRARVTYLVDLETMERFTHASGAVGTDICVREFRDKVRTMRRLRGEHVYAVVTLTDRFMPTRFGGRQRPDFKIMRWISFDPEDKVLPAPTLPKEIDHVSNTSEEAKPATKTNAQAQTKPATEIKPQGETKPTNTAAKPNKRGVVRTDKKTVGRNVADLTMEEILNDELPDNLK